MGQYTGFFKVSPLPVHVSAEKHKKTDVFSKQAGLCKWEINKVALRATCCCSCLCKRQGREKEQRGVEARDGKSDTC